MTSVEKDDAWKKAVAETNRLQRELDITNADHIALWIEHNTIPDEPMNQCASWLACRIVEAHEAALSTRPNSDADALLRSLTEAVEALPVEEWVEADGHGNPNLVGYVMQAQGEWDNVCRARDAARTHLSENNNAQ